MKKFKVYFNKIEYSRYSIIVEAEDFLDAANMVVSEDYDNSNLVSEADYSDGDANEVTDVIEVDNEHRWI